MQIRLLLELVDEMVMRSGAAPVWMQTPASVTTDGTIQSDGCAEEMSNTGVTEADGSCRDYDDFWSRTKYTVPEGVLTEDGSMAGFDNDLVIRYLDRVVVEDWGYRVVFKAGVAVEVEI